MKIDGSGKQEGDGKRLKAAGDRSGAFSAAFFYSPVFCSLWKYRYWAQPPVKQESLRKGDLIIR